MPQYFQVIENLSRPFYAMVVRGLMLSAKEQIVQAKMRKIEFILSGRCLHRFRNGEPQLLEAGDALVVPYRTEQIYVAPTEGDSGHLLSLIISFDSNILPFMDEETRQQNDDEMLDFLEKYFPQNRHLHQVIDVVLMETLSQIRREAELQFPGFRLGVSGLCNSAIVQLARLTENGSDRTKYPPESGRGMYLVSCAKEYLAQHLSENITLEDIAGYLQVSEGHLSRTFRSTTGQPLFTYLRHLRLEQAKLALLNSDNNITEIAREHGFNSLALFCRNFKEYTKMTPLNYRDKFCDTEE